MFPEHTLKYIFLVGVLVSPALAYHFGYASGDTALGMFGGIWVGLYAVAISEKL